MKEEVGDMILNNNKKLGPTPKSIGVEQEFQQIAKTEESNLLPTACLYEPYQPVHKFLEYIRLLDNPKRK